MQRGSGVADTRIVFAIVIALMSSVATASASGVISIEDARKEMETGHFFRIEGVVIHREQNRYFRVRDETGEMEVLIPQHLLRDVGMPGLNERLRLWGKFDHAKLDPSIQGMRVSRMERLGKVSGGAADPAAAGDAASVLPSVPPPAASAGKSSVIAPAASSELKERLGAKRREYDAARKAVDDAAAAYARALHAAGEGGQVDAEIEHRLELAEARMAEVSSDVPALVEEARKAGVSEEILRMYRQMVGQ